MDHDNNGQLLGAGRRFIQKSGDRSVVKRSPFDQGWFNEDAWIDAPRFAFGPTRDLARGCVDTEGISRRLVGGDAESQLFAAVIPGNLGDQSLWYTGYLLVSVASGIQNVNPANPI